MHPPKSLSCPSLAPLTCPSFPRSAPLSTRGLWLLGARRGDLNEYLEPAEQDDEEELSLCD